LWSITSNRTFRIDSAIDRSRAHMRMSAQAIKLQGKLMMFMRRALGRRVLVGALVACLAYAPFCAAQQLVVGSGARMSLGSTTLDVGCRDVAVTGSMDVGAGAVRGARDLSVSGTLNGGSGLLELSGDLTAGPNLVPQTGTVQMVDGCGSTESILIGDHQFNRLRVETNNGRALVLPAAGTQSISNSLELIGGALRLVMRSSMPGSVGFLNLQADGMQFVSRVDAGDVGAPASGQYLAPLLPEDYDSIDRGNTPRFFGEPEAEPIPIPTLSSFSLITMFLLFAGFGLFQTRAFAKGDC
jgi:hypothetical protein